MIKLKANSKMSPEQIYLPEVLSRRLVGRNVALKIGMKRLHLTVGGIKSEVQVHPSTLHELSVPDGINWRCYYNSESEQLLLGPSLAIITTLPPVPYKERPFGTRTVAYQEMSQLAAQTGGLVAVFTPPSLASSSSLVSAQVYKKEWRLHSLPCPQVFYNRIPTRRLENNHMSFLSRLESSGHIIFNTRFINKPEVYAALQSDPVLNTYLPETHPLTDETLKYFLAKGNSFFLKPGSSALGKGIIKVEADGPNWICLRQEKNRLAKYPPQDAEAIKRLLLGLCRGRNYLIQHAVPLAGNQGRVFDLRCLIQKNGQGCWEVVGLGARVSAPGLYLTHVPNGGEVWSADRALAWSFGTDKEPEAGNLENLLIAAAIQLERSLGLHLGVLSADVGLDADGHPFILELNSKPQRFDETVIRMSSHRHLLDYAGFLEGIIG